MIMFNSGGRHSIPNASITRVRVGTGRSHLQGARRGMKIGSVIGAGISVLWVGAFLTDPSTDGLPLLGGFVAGSLVTGVLWGAAIGAVAGAEGWRTAFP